jgi:hypothetical protein
VASLILPLGTRRWGGWGGKDGGPLDGATRTMTEVGGLGGCLDSAATGPHDGSRAEEEKTARRRN